MKDDADVLKDKIDILKDLLNKQLDSKDFDREEILKISQELDICILEYYKNQ
ncbi:aspartyl-phosphate phosphatase Spo0E family protein [Schnuerera sp. xch1]|uniref:aspartyl-phosphate phosphatase Spo0E family protein n=1 Tax=Schnuerera sp. xch1 TaxID=2874283 RepID=UPI001CBAF876|nr:aspartyl-phosphate phosphatase Spo0E family protein [Schnuerera sp. xch1]MBZ2175439.1 aspartyl-phosphate phosphatase Spo0E family protein [Schnuerera sp. xch1]